MVGLSGGETSCASLVALASVSSAAVRHVVMMAKVSIRSWSCGPDSSSEEARSRSGWILFLFLGIVVFLAGFIRVFLNFGAMLENSSRENKSICVFQAAMEYAGSGTRNKPGMNFPSLSI